MQILRVQAGCWLTVALMSAILAGGEERALNRTLLVPIRFETCEHLENARLSRNEGPLRRLSDTQLFQFTYYPHLSRLEPQLERVAIEGEHRGERFRSEVVVTPSSVYIGNKRIVLDTERHKARWRGRRDIRHRTVDVGLKCEQACPRETAELSSESR